MNAKFIIGLVLAIFFSLSMNAMEHEHKKGLVFENSWIRLAPPVAENSAGYFTVTNHAKETIKITSVESTVAKHTALHDMLIVDGAMAMEHIPELVLKAGESVEFRPGGKHLMLIGLVEPLKLDQKVEVTFVLSNGTKQALTMVVKRAAMKKMMKHH